MIQKAYVLLILSVFSLTLWGRDSDWLKGQIHSSSGHSFIESYQGGGRSYIYDQALAIIYFSYRKDFATASKLLKTMQKVQAEDGSWPFYYELNGEGKVDYKPNGAIAWVALSALTYQHLSRDKTFTKIWQKSLNYLSEQFVPLPGANLKVLPFSSNDYSQSKWNEKNVASLEHAIDTLSAFKLARRLSHHDYWSEQEKDLEKFVSYLWDKDAKHFWSGVKIDDQKIDKETFYLDNQTWTALAMENVPALEPQLKLALNASCRLAVVDKQLAGFSESRSPASIQDFIWSEGTAGAILAFKKFKIKCDQFDSKLLPLSLKRMTASNGGVRYAHRENKFSFSDKESVAGTTWTWFIENNINPFLP